MLGCFCKSCLLLVSNSFWNILGDIPHNDICFKLAFLSFLVWNYFAIPGLPSSSQQLSSQLVTLSQWWVPTSLVFQIHGRVKKFLQMQPDLTHLMGGLTLLCSHSGSDSWWKLKVGRGFLPIVGGRGYGPQPRRKVYIQDLGSISLF